VQEKDSDTKKLENNLNVKNLLRPAQVRIRKSTSFKIFAVQQCNIRTVVRL